MKEKQKEKKGRKPLVYASLFSGFGAPDLAAEWMGWQNAFHCEIDPFCNRILNYWFPDAQSYTDITTTDFGNWRGKVNVLTGGFPCFDGDTLVLTSEGFKPIREIRAGDDILTREGRFKKCNAVMKSHKRNIIRLKAQGLWEPVITTDNHPFWTCDRQGQYQWKRAGEIKKGDRIAYRCIDGTDTSFTPAFWKMVGRFLGDGWILDGRRKSNIPAGHRGSRINSFNHKVVICCGKKAKSELEKLIKDAGYAPTISEDRTTFKFIISNRELCSFFKGFGRYAIGKKLSGQCFNLEHERKKALYEGYFSADGHEEKNGAMRTTTISEQLAAGIAQIARDVFHRPVSISKKIPKRICVIEGRQVNEHPLYCVTVSPNERYGYYKDGFIWCLVKNIERKYERRTVFNIGVETDETYTANGIVVHNCQPFSVAGQRQGAEDNRYLWPHMLRAIHEIRPDWVIGENVAGILTMVQPGQEAQVGSQSTLFGESELVFKRRQQYVVETICRDLEREGYSVQPLLIPACAVGAPHRRDRVWFIAHRNGSGLQAQRSEQPPAGTAGNHSWSASAHPTGYGNTSSGESPQMEAGPSFFPPQADRRGEESQRSERFSGLLRSATHSGSQRCRRGGCHGEKRQDYCNSEGKDKENQSERPCLERRTWEDGGTFADSDSEGLERCCQCGESGEERTCTGKEQSSRFLCPDWKEFPTQSPVCGRDDGVSARLDGISFSQWRQASVKGYGNAIVPQVVYEIFKAIEETYKSNGHE